MTNASKLRQLKAQHELTRQDVADLLGVSPYTVKSWLLHEGSEAHRAMSDRELEFLNLKLGVKS